jgi:suppressor for copper-sensitivity B
MKRFRPMAGVTMLALMFCALAYSPLDAQTLQQDLQRLNLGGGQQGQVEPLSFSATFATHPEGGATLSITAEIEEGWHTYSLTQESGGPLPTTIKLDKSDQYKVAGEFTPSPKPKTHVDTVAFKGVTLEEHEGKVTWSAPVELAPGVDPKTLKISGKVNAMACEQQCLPPKDYKITAKFVGSQPKPAPPAEPEAGDDAGDENADKPTSAGLGKRQVGAFQADNVTFRGYLSPKTVVPGGKAKLVVTAEPAAKWHIYELSAKAVTKAGSKPTLLLLTKTAGWELGPASASRQPVKGLDGPGYHEEPVTWTVELSVPDDAKPGNVTLEGLLGYQLCLQSSCMSPTAVGISGRISVGAKEIKGEVPLKFTADHSYTEVEKQVKQQTNSQGALPGGAAGPGGGDQSNAAGGGNTSGGTGGLASESSLALMMGTGFLAGLILNIMPCVLPVIGLKVLSFVEQSHHRRAQSFMLNVWYSLGILAVFLVLATLPVVARLAFNKQFAWGQQFSYDPFNITLAALVFVMALSFLGVWEIPIPGFASGRAAGELAAKEGFSGAFFKGAITTVLATPCGAPLLGPVLGFAVTQPPLVTYVIFVSIGLGMASPYLLIGAFPELVRFLPKPGAWMDTFKQTMGFVLLATVVYLMYLIQWAAVVPTFALLMGLWAGCWWVGRTPLYAEFAAKLRAYAVGAVFATVVGLVAFQWLSPIMQYRLNRYVAAHGGAANEDEDWAPFSVAKLRKYSGEGKIVVVDFTADWCLTCKVLAATVLNVDSTHEFVKRNGIVTMMADMTRQPEDLQQILVGLSPSGLVPVLAIYPANRPEQPIVLDTTYTQDMLFQKLKEAGASDAPAAADLTAMNKR